MNNKQGPVFIQEPCGCCVDHGIPYRCAQHTLPVERSCARPDCKVKESEHGLEKSHFFERGEKPPDAAEAGADEADAKQFVAADAPYVYAHAQRRMTDAVTSGMAAPLVLDAAGKVIEELAAEAGLPAPDGSKGRWMCETHHDLVWPHDDCAGPGMWVVATPRVEDLLDGEPLLGMDILQRLEQHYDFVCEGGPLKHCIEWGQLKMMMLAHSMSRRELFIEGYIAGKRSANDHPGNYRFHRAQAEQAWKLRDSR